MATKTTKAPPAAESPSAAPPTINADASIPQEFLQMCEEAAGQAAADYFNEYAVGATADNGVITVEVRAYDRMQARDLSASDQFTISATRADVLNSFQAKCQTEIVGCTGVCRLATEAPHAPPRSDVTPPV